MYDDFDKLNYILADVNSYQLLNINCYKLTMAIILSSDKNELINMPIFFMVKSASDIIWNRFFYSCFVLKYWEKCFSGSLINSFFF